MRFEKDGPSLIDEDDDDDVDDVEAERTRCML